MADEKDKPTTPEEAAEAAKKAREEAVEAQDNPPEPFPNQEQLDKIQGGASADEVFGEGDVKTDEGDAERKRKADAEAEAKRKAATQTKDLAADKPAGYQTR